MNEQPTSKPSNHGERSKQREALSPPLVLTSPFERGSRVTFRDSPKWKAYLRANE